jgi:zinc protease
LTPSGSGPQSPSVERHPLLENAVLDRFNARAVFRAAFAAILLFALPAFAADWPRSDLPPDPSVTFGTLPNGMRYAIRHNATPTGEVSVRLHIAAGALQEAPQQRGLAHFLEHMAFRGSAKVKDGEYSRMLERIGLRFGADTNASTGQEETIYQFDLPRSDDASLDTAFLLSREIASGLTIAPEAAKAESGVVGSELRLRDVPSFQSSLARLEFLLGDKRAAQLPHGDAAVIARGSVEELRAFYHAYYRPERATMIVVGDIDPAKIEARIRTSFSDWKGVGPAIADPALNIPLNRGLEVKTFSGAGVSNTVSLTWTAPPEKRPSDTAAERASLIEMIAFRVLNRRYQEESVTPERPFTRANVSRGQSYQAVRMTTLSVGYQPGQWKTALTQAEKMRLALLDNGVTQAELDRALTEFRASLEQRAKGAATRPSRAIVNALLDSMGENEVYTSDTRDLTAFDAYVKGLTLAEVNKALREAFAGGGPLIFASGEQAIDGGEEAVKTAYLDAQKADRGAIAQMVVKPWPYTNFGAPGKVVATQTLRDLGVTYLRFANGVRLTVKPTKFRANEVEVQVKIGNGRLELPRDRITATWAGTTVISGGLKQLTSTEMGRTLAGRQVGTGFGVGEDGFLFSGSTIPRDLQLQMEVMAAYVREPAFRPESFERARTAYLERLRNSGTSPGAVMGLKMPEILHDGDKRWASATMTDVESARVEELRDLLQPVLEKGAIEVTIVGDTTVEEAIAVTARTFGAFAPRAASRIVSNRTNTTRFPAGSPEVTRLITTDQKGQEIATMVWPTQGRFPDLRASITLQMLSTVMNDRLFDRMRGLGAVYSAQVNATSSKVFDYGYVQALAQLQPSAAALFQEELTKIVADLKAGQLSEDELTRAREPALESLRKARETNDYWVSVLDDTSYNPAKLELARQYEPILRSITAADIAAAARRYLVDSKSVRISVGPPAS